MDDRIDADPGQRKAGYTRPVRRGIAGLVVLIAAAAAACAAAEGPQSAQNARPALILVSFDGWRWDYAAKAPTPNLQRLIARGVRAEGLIPSFPPRTFPNHYTIVTGLYPAHHGIISNSIYDPPTGRLFATSKPEEVRDAMWWGGEPLWVTVEREGGIAASMFWPGSEAPIHGVLPTYTKAYDAAFPPNARVDQVLRWLDLPAAERPSFVTLYFSDADDAGHDFGPESAEVRAAITGVDRHLGRLLDGLEARGLTDRVNVVVLSDHGMAAVSPDRAVVIDEYISLADVTLVELSPMLGLFPKPGKEEEIHRALVAAHPRLKVYRRGETPAAWQYRDHPRIPPLIGVVDEGWQVLTRAMVDEIRSGRRTASGGQHGYADAASMRGVFVAAGPSFTQGATVPAFANVHVYNALAGALGMTPAPNDGDPAIARSLLR
jgi:predicted AlkP superfamily pyrophosphatase or phosphodiesterase